MTYLPLFERVAEHVRQKGVQVRCDRGQPLAFAAIERARTQAFIAIRASLLDFYAEIGDGFEFGWSSIGNNTTFANLEISRIANCAPKSIDDVSWLTEWNDDYEFSHARDPALAKATALKMRRWLSFFNLGNGDNFCLDTSLHPSPVLFNQHDWYDGG